MLKLYVNFVGTHDFWTLLKVKLVGICWLLVMRPAFYSIYMNIVSEIYKYIANSRPIFTFYYSGLWIFHHNLVFFVSSWSPDYWLGVSASPNYQNFSQMSRLRSSLCFFFFKMQMVKRKERLRQHYLTNRFFMFSPCPGSSWIRLRLPSKSGKRICL